MSTNFNIKSMDANGAVIRILADNKLIDCRWSAFLEDDQRMGWLKQTANEYLKNAGLEQHIVPVPTVQEDISDDPEHPVLVEMFAPECNTDNLPDTDEPDAPGFWDRVREWLR